MKQGRKDVLSLSLSPSLPQFEEIPTIKLNNNPQDCEASLRKTIADATGRLRIHGWAARNLAVGADLAYIDGSIRGQGGLCCVQPDTINLTFLPSLAWQAC